MAPSNRRLASIEVVLAAVEMAVYYHLSYPTRAPYDGFIPEKDAGNTVLVAALPALILGLVAAFLTVRYLDRTGIGLLPPSRSPGLVSMPADSMGRKRHLAAARRGHYIVGVTVAVLWVLTGEIARTLLPGEPVPAGLPLFTGVVLWAIMWFLILWAGFVLTASPSGALFDRPQRPVDTRRVMARVLGIYFAVLAIGSQSFVTFYDLAPLLYYVVLLAILGALLLSHARSDVWGA
jgi:hypothetical protein